MTDVEHKRKQVEKLEAGNERSYAELRQATENRFSMDTSDMRRELLIDSLVEWGIITEEQVLDFDIEFHNKVEVALNDAWSQYREMKAEAERPKIAAVTKPSKLVDQNGRPLS